MSVFSQYVQYKKELLPQNTTQIKKLNAHITSHATALDRPTTKANRKSTTLILLTVYQLKTNILSTKLVNIRWLIQTQAAIKVNRFTGVNTVAGNNYTVTCNTASFNLDTSALHLLAVKISRRNRR